MNRSLTLIFVSSILAISTASADDVADRMRACAMETDETRRLACYDAAAGATQDQTVDAEQAPMAEATAAPAAAAAAAVVVGADAAPDEAASAEAAVEAEVASAEAAAEEPVAVATASAAAAAEATPAEVSEAEAAAAEAQFGMNYDLEKTIPDDQKAFELRELSAVAIEVSKRPGGEHIVTIENGQKWVEKYAVYGFRVEVGDTVLLKKGAFGGYKMVGRGRRSSQVRRVE
jgi:hypothetical protein